MAQRSRRSAPPSVPAVPRRSPAQLTETRDRVRDLIEPVLAKAGYDLEDLGVRQVGRRYQLRVTVDGDGGVTLDTIAELSRAVADALDAAEESGEEIFPGEYQLEVSSPGVDRPLTLPRHWRRSVGRLVAVKVQGDPTASDSAQKTDRQVTGRVLAADETSVTLELAEKKTVIKQTYALDRLGPGRVQIEFNRLDEISDEDLEEIADSDDGVDEDLDEEDVEEQ
ncbi:MAG: ribosome maturation factor RimP [Hamadaea sp.]|uniref:ribosome maturation factor RimP n=1 Tax=Hamadaea sp. TaxID=2024425 RepID=UPI0018358E5A|nr:ribosome maturation factor RimP [Hamadaea sp.]NUR71657.1 ribosome maturation factor RimP [Hamadaea sp.]NUT20221.1 ribosome maturation factor RimP [Hamadaea sp.]